jgi:TPR repeat protein
MHNVANMLMNAPTNPDFNAARALYLAAAERGHADAMASLGQMYDEGRGVPQNFAEAMRWYRAGTERQSPTAATFLARMYLDGRGTPSDPKQALLLFQVGAAGEVNAALTYLGWMYEQGIGVERNRVQALRWYRLGAERGNVGAHMLIGAAMARDENWSESACRISMRPTSVNPPVWRGSDRSMPKGKACHATPNARSDSTGAQPRRTPSKDSSCSRRPTTMAMASSAITWGRGNSIGVRQSGISPQPITPTQ